MISKYNDKNTFPEKMVGGGRDDAERTIFKHNLYYIQFHLSLKDFGLFIHLLTYSFTIFIKALLCARNRRCERKQARIPALLKITL